MSNSVHANNRTKNILVFGRDLIHGLDNTAIYTEKFYSINFTMEQTVIYLLMVQKFINLKQKILKLW